MSAAIGAPPSAPLWQLALAAREREQRAALAHARAVANGRLGGLACAKARAKRRERRERRSGVDCADCSRAGALFAGPRCRVCWRRDLAAGAGAG